MENEENKVNVAEEVTKEMEAENVSEEREETGIAKVQGFGAMNKRSNTKADIFTNITNQKKIFNLDSKVDVLLNDCENEVIRVKEVLVKRYEKPLAKPVVIKQAVIDETTGEVLEDEVVKNTEITMACILIDDQGKSYATGSKIFTIQMMRYIDMFGIDEKGFEIKIVKNKQTTGNKALGFELV